MLCLRKQEAAEGGGGDEDSTFPTLEALLGYVASRHSRLGKPAEPSEPLLMEARSMETLVEFARLCWQKQQPAGPASQVRMSRRRGHGDRSSR